MSTAIDLKEKYTYADYLHWSDGERWELIHGHAYNMSPAPTRRHQKILRRLSQRFANYLDGKPFEVYFASFDVRLAHDYSDDHLVESVVQPDLSVFCDPKRLDEKGATGAPDLVVEVLSPSTAAKDMKTKLLLYQEFMVKEYWLVDTEENKVEQFWLEPNGKYLPGKVYSGAVPFKCLLFPDLHLDLEEIFKD